MLQINVEEYLTMAYEIGTAREQMNGGNDTAAYRHNGVLPFNSLRAQRFAVLGEIATHLLLGVDLEETEWVLPRDRYAELKTKADLEWRGTQIDVRNATKTTSPLPIKQKDYDLGALVVQTYVHLDPAGTKPSGVVSFLGWKESTGYPKYVHRAGTAYVVNKRPMHELWEWGVKHDVA